MTYRQDEAAEFAKRVKDMGFIVYMADNGTHGFITDEKESRVMSFSFSIDSKLSGNYGPPSQKSGTGWALAEAPENLKVAVDVHNALYAQPPSWCGGGWKYLTNVKQYLAAYGDSSKYKKLGD